MPRARRKGRSSSPSPATIASMMTSELPRLDAVLRQACERIERGDATVLLAHALSRSTAWLYAHGDAAVQPAELSRYESLIARRAQGEPVAYLTGRRGFWCFDLMVTPDTLIPRPETERLVELALERIATTAGVRIADLGTGSGAIALALAYERRDAEVIATDISPAALQVAATNARALRLNNVMLREGSWWAPLQGETFDLVASNPPYIADHDPHLHRGDLRYEPAKALSSGRDGLDAISILVHGAPMHLREGGWLLLEHGWTQGEAVRVLMSLAGFASVHTARDIEGRDRVTLGQCWARP
jgi:release factor glutamine methyltransferase